MDIQPCGSNEAIAYYMAKYIAKSEPSNLNAGLASALREIRNENTDVGKKMFKASMIILQERQISGCKSAFRLCHLPLRDSSRKCVFVNTRKERLYSIRFEGNQAVGLNSNIFKRYENRPREQVGDFDFPRLSLIEFAMRFEPNYKESIEEESVDAEIPVNNTRKRFITLTNGQKMIIRSFDAFLAREEQLRNNRFMHTMRQRDQQLEDAFRQAHAFELIQEPEEAFEAEIEVEQQPAQMADDDFNNGLRAMNLQQRELFNLITTSIQRQLNGETRQLRLFVTGGAGVGKTYTFKMLVEQINRCYGQRAVFIGALNGVAVKLVGGSTLHSLFKLGVKKDGYIRKLQPLSGRYLVDARRKWAEIKYLMTDEISMVNYAILANIDARLRQINDNEEIFALRLYASEKKIKRPTF